MALRKIWPILLLLTLGAVMGFVSGLFPNIVIPSYYRFPDLEAGIIGSTVPGALFGLGLAIAYLISNRLTIARIKDATILILASTCCFFGTFWITAAASPLSIGLSFAEAFRADYQAGGFAQLLPPITFGLVGREEPPSR